MWGLLELVPLRSSGISLVFLYPSPGIFSDSSTPGHRRHNAGSQGPAQILFFFFLHSFYYSIVYYHLLLFLSISAACSFISSLSYFYPRQLSYLAMSNQAFLSLKCSCRHEFSGLFCSNSFTLCR